MTQPSTVKFRVSEELLSQVFRIADFGTIVGASVEVAPFGSVNLVVFDVETALAPEGAVEMVPSYMRLNTVGPDPVQITGFQWVYVDGSSDYRQVPPPELPPFNPDPSMTRTIHE